MKAFLLLVLLSTSSWNGSLWNSFDPSSKLIYVEGFRNGLEVGAFLSHDKSLVIPRNIETIEIVLDLDLFYLGNLNQTVSLPNAIRFIGGK